MYIWLLRLAKKVAEITMSNVKHWEGTPVAAKTMPVPADWTPGQWTGEDSGDSEEECRPGGEENDSLMFQYNEALYLVCRRKLKMGNSPF